MKNQLQSFYHKEEFLVQNYQNIKYSFDAVGNVLGYENNCLDNVTGNYKTRQTYSYDNLYQLIRVEGETTYNPYRSSVPEFVSNYSQNFEFDIDGLGNMTSKVSKESVRPNKKIGETSTTILLMFMMKTLLTALFVLANVITNMIQMETLFVSKTEVLKVTETTQLTTRLNKKLMMSTQPIMAGVFSEKIRQVQQRPGTGELTPGMSGIS